MQSQQHAQALGPPGLVTISSDPLIKHELATRAIKLNTSNMNEKRNALHA